ncbi:MAG: glycosyl hydrolase family 28-related protein [Balneolales bacterium]
MQKHLFLCLIFLLVLSTNASLAQTSTSLHNGRLAAWAKAGLATGFPTEFDHTIHLNDYGVTGNGKTNDSPGITKAIDHAKSLDGWVNIIFPAGTFVLTRQIDLNNADKIVISGAGPAHGPKAVPEGTTLQFDDSQGDFMPSGHLSILFDIRGTTSAALDSVISYNHTLNQITVSSRTSKVRAGDLLKIEPTWVADNKFLGTMARVKDITGGRITLEDDFSLPWNDRGDITFKVTLVQPASNIGVEDLSIERIGNYALSHNDNPGLTFYFRYAFNSRINNVYSTDPVSQHITAHYSHRLEIKDSFFDDAQNHDGYGGGQGYGIALTRYTSHSLVEDNIFAKLRHSFIVSRGASYNVFGYNYSREVTFTSGNDTGDLSIHGHYPYANLFEGNRVDRIVADAYHSVNGPFNTLLRNYSYYDDVRIEGSDYLNMSGNEGGLKELKNSAAVTNVYEVDEPSYYLDQRPAFLDESFTWPPIGPPVGAVILTTQDIPARRRYCGDRPDECE